MGTRGSLAVVVGWCLACGGIRGLEPPPPPPPPPPVPEPVVEAPVPPPTPEPVPTGAIWAAVAPFSGDDVAVVCTQGGKPIECPVGPCLGEYNDRCQAGPEVNVVGLARLEAGALALPLAKATLTSYMDPACSWSQAAIMEGDATTAPRAVAAVSPDDASLAPLKALGGATSTVSAAFKVDLDGKAGDELVAEIATETGGLLAVLRPDGSTVTIFDNRREPLPEDASEEARMEYETQASSLVWLGVTDSENDGVIEFVLEGSGYEASWIVVMGLHGDAVGSVGCAV